MLNPAQSIVTPAAETVMQVSVESISAMSVHVSPGVAAQVLQSVQVPQFVEIVISDVKRDISSAGVEVVTDGETICSTTPRGFETGSTMLFSDESTEGTVSELSVDNAATINVNGFAIVFVPSLTVMVAV